MNEKLLRYFNEIEKIHWWWEGRRQILRQSIEKKNGLKILDIGCGTGETLTFLEKNYPKSKLFGVDNSEVAIDFAKKRGHQNIRKVNALKLPYRENSFDYILLLDVIEHIEDDTALLKEAKRVLKKGGKIIITAPALQFIWSEHDSEQGHFRRYTRSRLRLLAQRVRLKICRLSYFNFFLSPAIISLRIIGKLRPFKHINSYDSKLNFDVAKKSIINDFLKFIFVSEVKLMRYVSYPIGISVYAVFQKK